MDQERLHAALARIDAAAERIARSHDTRPAADAGLARRHQNLRTQASAALARLDQLILELEQ